MKLPNWLHRKSGLMLTCSDFDWPPNPYADVPPPDPYLNSLLSTPTESIEGAHARGYWEGRADGFSDAGLAPTPEYSVEVRRPSGAIDEVLLHDADRCLVHLERLDTDHWWLMLYPTDGWDEATVFDLFRAKKCIEVTEQ